MGCLIGIGAAPKLSNGSSSRETACILLDGCISDPDSPRFLFAGEPIVGGKTGPAISLESRLRGGGGGTFSRSGDARSCFFGGGGGVDLLVAFLGDECEERGEFEAIVRLLLRESTSSDSGVRVGFFFGGGGGGGRAAPDAFGGAGGGERSRVGSLAFGGGGGTPPKN